MKKHGLVYENDVIFSSNTSSLGLSCINVADFLTLEIDMLHLQPALTQQTPDQKKTHPNH